MSKRYQAAILTASYNGLQVPNAPTIGTATAGIGSASVTFTAPSNVGGGAITSYTVISSPGSILGTGSSSPITVSGLTNGTAYTFTVVATNAYGSGPASAASNSVTPAVNYIEDVFSTWLYTGNGSTQTITNGIDLAGKGGLVWVKRRSSPANDHAVMDTARGIATNGAWTLIPNGTYAQFDNNTVTSFNSNGFTLGSSSFGNSGGGFDYASWTFRKQPKFFDVVTYTGNGVAGREIPHSLGSAPGCVIIKCLNGETNWSTWHNGIAANQVLFLNTTDASYAEGDFYATAPTSTVFTVASFGRVNGSGSTYVAYLFADDAGGFGAAGTDNVISCGSYTGNGAAVGPTVTLGYEPQWLLIKRTSTAGAEWVLYDNMRGLPVGSGDAVLYPNANYAEYASGDDVAPTATGFYLTNGNGTTNLNGATYIYIAIRRGPMAVPTVGTSVFLPQVRTGTGSTTTVTTGLNSDSMWFRRIVDGQAATLTIGDKLRGTTKYLETANTNSEQTYATSYVNQYLNTGVTIGNGTEINQSYVASNIGSWYFTRAPGFFDEVCYTGDGSNRTITHNLTVAPEMMIVKSRSGVYEWSVYSAPQGASARTKLNLSDAQQTGTFVWNYTAPTSTVFSLGTASAVNDSAYTYVAYLFATLAGVSKVGSYTGTGALLTVNCGFTSGARFVLIKRTDSTGDWYVYDTARGMTSGNDPYFFTNTSDGAVTSTNYVDTDVTGFKITAAAPAGLNASGGTYIFLAIA